MEVKKAALALLEKDLIRLLTSPLAIPALPAEEREEAGATALANTMMEMGIQASITPVMLARCPCFHRGLLLVSLHL